MRRICLLGSDDVPQERPLVTLPPIRRKKQKSNPKNDKVKQDKVQSKHQENQRSRHDHHKKQRNLTLKNKTKKKQFFFKW